jgi:type II secretory ATPase GspE/PulE/Tfp pilus assembly ATPase PilB-like protein
MGEEMLNREIKPADWVDAIITQGINAKASDIHFEPQRDKFVVYYRIDGVLHFVDSMPLAYLETAIAHLKILAHLDITEHRRPQDGHILFQPKSLLYTQPIDLRLSIFPTAFGEAAVLRVLQRKDLLFESLEKLGMESETAERLRKILQKPSGMILVTGPGGSGKTTTLYTILNYLANQKPKLNIMTLEDPIELLLPGIRQSQIFPEIGFTFAEGLRSILRQDANVIMIGEIRDKETAEISVRASLMGCLFFSTMHTINSVGAIIRFLEFGLPRSLIASSLLAIIAQRLVRVICPHCKVKAEPDRELMKLVGISKEDESKLFKGKGCQFCDNTGYLGRTGVFEVMFVDKEIQRLILEGAHFTEIEKQAQKNGMQTLQEAAVKKVLEGVTTLEEALRVIPF